MLCCSLKRVLHESRPTHLCWGHAASRVSALCREVSCRPMRGDSRALLAWGDCKYQYLSRRTCAAFCLSRVPWLMGASCSARRIHTVVFRHASGKACLEEPFLEHKNIQALGKHLRRPCACWWSSNSWGVSCGARRDLRRLLRCARPQGERPRSERRSGSSCSHSAC